MAQPRWIRRWPTRRRLSDDYRACVVQNNAESDTKQQRKCVKQVDPSIPDLLIGITE